MKNDQPWYVVCLIVRLMIIFFVYNCWGMEALCSLSAKNITREDVYYDFFTYTEEQLENCNVVEKIVMLKKTLGYFKRKCPEIYKNLIRYCVCSSCCDVYCCSKGCRGLVEQLRNDTGKAISFLKRLRYYSLYVVGIDGVIPSTCRGLMTKIIYLKNL